MARKKKAEDVVVKDVRIETLKSGEIKVGIPTLNEMCKRTGQLIDLVYQLSDRIAALEAKAS